MVRQLVLWRVGARFMNPMDPSDCVSEGTTTGLLQTGPQRAETWRPEAD
jgi:hypothetical protein